MCDWRKNRKITPIKELENVRKRYDFYLQTLCGLWFKKAKV